MRLTQVESFTSRSENLKALPSKKPAEKFELLFGINIINDSRMAIRMAMQVPWIPASVRMLICIATNMALDGRLRPLLNLGVEKVVMAGY